MPTAHAGEYVRELASDAEMLHRIARAANEACGRGDYEAALEWLLEARARLDDLSMLRYRLDEAIRKLGQRASHAADDSRLDAGRGAEVSQ